jgi:hypothetical protein
VTQPRDPNDDDELDPADEESLIPTSDDEGSEDQLSDTERYEGYLEAGYDPSGNSVESLAANELRVGETDDPYVAADEGLAYVPPADPVVVADRSSPEGVRVAAGPGTSALDEPFDADHHGEALTFEDEVTDRVREALRADASTSQYADELELDTEGGVVTIRGVVEDIEDSDAIAEVASYVDGVVEVRDETEVEGL